MGGSMLSCFSRAFTGNFFGALKRHHLMFRYFVWSYVLFALAACAPERESSFQRVPLPRLAKTEFSPLLPVSQSVESELLSSFFENSPKDVSASLAACAWIEAYPELSLDEARFRMAENLVIHLGGKKIEIHANSANSMETESFLGQISSRAHGAEAGEIYSLNGRIDIAANAIYQFGLTRTLREGEDGRGIPDRARFMRELDEEISKKDLFIGQPFARLKQLILGLGVVDFYKLRNDLITTKIHESLPGVFDHNTREKSQVYRLFHVIPEIVFSNAIRDQFSVLPNLSDNKFALATKLVVLKRMLKNFEKPLPLFVNNSWLAFEKDSRISVNLALSGMLSNKPSEQVCGAVLFNRSLSQLLSLIGYVRPPMIQDSVLKTSRLPEFKKMLNHDQGSVLKSCPIPGVFSTFQEGRNLRLLIDENDLGTTENRDYLLPARIPAIPACDPSVAVAENSWDYLHFSKFYNDSVAGSDEWLALLRAVSQFLVAFNPGAEWWRGDRQFPLMNLQDLNKAALSEGILPYESHALALGIINLAVTQFEKKHLVLMNSAGQEVLSSDDAMALRISQKPRIAGAKGKVATTVYSATLLTEAAFKFGVSFKRLAEWKTTAEKMRSDMEFIKNPEERKLMIADYDGFMQGVFGSIDNLEMLTEESDDSVRSLLSNLQVATALLMSSFVRQKSDGSYGCFAEIENDLDQATEKMIGVCTAEEERRFKVLMRILAKTYQSPLFSRYSE